jgi:hypothetical protein
MQRTPRQRVGEPGQGLQVEVGVGQGECCEEGKVREEGGEVAEGA